jgi:hypothetical protein
MIVATASDTLENLELVELDVYWGLKTRGLPQGTSVEK